MTEVSQLSEQVRRGHPVQGEVIDFVLGDLVDIDSEDLARLSVCVCQIGLVDCEGRDKCRWATAAGEVRVSVERLVRRRQRYSGRRCIRSAWFHDQGMCDMAQGTIKKLVKDRGFGFISTSSGKGDVFFHVSAVADGACAGATAWSTAWRSRASSR